MKFLILNLTFLIIITTRGLSYYLSDESDLIDEDTNSCHNNNGSTTYRYYLNNSQCPDGTIAILPTQEQSYLNRNQSRSSRRNIFTKICHSFADTFTGPEYCKSQIRNKVNQKYNEFINLLPPQEQNPTSPTNTSSTYGCSSFDSRDCGPGGRQVIINFINESGLETACQVAANVATQSCYNQTLLDSSFSGVCAGDLRASDGSYPDVLEICSNLVGNKIKERCMNGFCVPAI